MKNVKTLVATLLLITSTFTFANPSRTVASESSFMTGISDMMSVRIAEVFEKSGDPANGIIDVQLFEKNVQASIDQVSKMPDSSEKEILTAANENLTAVATLIKDGTFTKAHIIGYYTKMKN